MCIQWQVEAEQTHSTPNECRDLAIPRPGQRPETIPKKPVMNDQEMKTPSNRSVDGFLAGINSGGYPRDFRRAIHLETVQSMRVIREIRDPEGIRQKLEDLF